MNQLASGSIARLFGTLERFMDTRIEPNSSGLESMTSWLKTSKMARFFEANSIIFVPDLGLCTRARSSPFHTRNSVMVNLTREPLFMKIALD